MENKIASYWWLESAVGSSFNRLKAKIFNLVEASVVDKTQQEALKGLIKGFANEEYRACLQSMRQEAEQAKIIKDDEIKELMAPLSAFPLDNVLDD
jgi:hypothetical protein